MSKKLAKNINPWRLTDQDKTWIDTPIIHRNTLKTIIRIATNWNQLRWGNIYNGSTSVKEDDGDRCRSFTGPPVIEKYCDRILKRSPSPPLPEKIYI